MILLFNLFSIYKHFCYFYCFYWWHSNCKIEWYQNQVGLDLESFSPIKSRKTLFVRTNILSYVSASRSDVKLKVDVPILTNEDCASRFSETDDVNLRINQMCAGGTRDKDSCRGDSGGPLMRLYVHNRRQWFQEGIVSRGLGCGRMGRPAIYTRVNRYINWILNVIKL